MKKKTKVSSKLTDQFNTPLIRNKRSAVTPYVLRQLAKNNNLVQVVINRLKHSAVKVPYIVRAIEEEKQEELKPQIDFVKNLLKRPNPDDSFRKLFSKVIDDVLTIDMGVVEKVRDSRGYITELYSVDGATIYPQLDEYGNYKDIAYKQFIELGSDKPDAEFELDELLVCQLNPQTENDRQGFGKSPVESIVQTVISSLQAMIYNTSFFSDSKVPPFMANLQGVSTKDLIAFKSAFETQVANNSWTTVFTNAEKMDMKSLRPSNQEMQFYELNLWLARIIFATFEVSPQDMGFTMDVNKATAGVQERITKSQGVANLLDVMTEEINKEIISDLATIDPKFDEIEFTFDVQDKIDAKVQAEVDQIYVTSGIRTPDELRARDGLDPLPEKEEMQSINISDLEKSDKWRTVFYQ